MTMTARQTLPVTPDAVEAMRAKATGFVSENRKVVTLTAMALCAGILVGWKMAGGPKNYPKGAPGVAGPVGGPRVADQPCAGCREKEIQAEQARRRAMLTQGGGPVAPDPGPVASDVILDPAPGVEIATAGGGFDHSQPAEGRVFSPLVSPAVTPPEAPGA
jgi:hypothetical protein